MEKRPVNYSLGSWVDWLFSLGAIVAISYSLIRAHDLDPDAWSSIAGPLFSLASGFLFVLALRFQLKEHRQALAEMEQANVNHGQMLLVARQEKEFTVCLRAIELVDQRTLDFKFSSSVGLSAVKGAVENWAFIFDKVIGNRGSPVKNRYFSALRNTDDVFEGFNKLDELNVLMYWVLHAVNRKDIAEDDRQYLNTLIFPIIRDVGYAQFELARLMQCMVETLALGDDQLKVLGIDRLALELFHKDMARLYARREPRR
jgi:hypothetical protein